MCFVLRIASFAAVVGLLAAADPSAARAGNCEVPLKQHYKCSATYSNGGSSEYCLRADVVVPDDGQFRLVEEGFASYFCTCAPRGRPPLVRFGAASRDFTCASGDNVTLAGKVSGSRIVGYGYDTTITSGLRSSFTCRPVDTCP